MIVNAEYYPLSNGKYYRRKTLLQFGNSTNLIGSAVLINPGSSCPIGPSETDFINSFYNENHNDELIDLKVWKNFRPDSTMLQLAKLFNGWYGGNERPLNGVIQLFNCFYFKEQDLDKAIQSYPANNRMVFEEYHLFKVKPVYFGWGNAGKIDPIKDIAFKIFSKYDIKQTPIYESEFEKNCFYHPGYLNRSYKRNSNSIEIVSKFSNLFI